MLFRRHFTIMVLPDAHLKLRRLQFRGAHFFWALAVLGIVGGLAASAPLLGLWAGQLSGQLAEVREERDRLAERSHEVEATLAELRRKVDQFERRTDKMASLAGLNIASGSHDGLGQPNGVANLAPTLRADVLRNEADDLSERSALLERRLDVVEQALTERSERLARMPSLLPVAGLIGGGFGWRRDPFTGAKGFHRGVDVSAPVGTPILAPADGIVIAAERESGYGHVLTISHGDGMVTRYGHLSAFKTRPGAEVRRGDTIALVGNSGRSTGPHLHYEVLVEGQQVDPMAYILDEGSGF
ncbi:MAG: peptidoglycan DD-metalloendopeptidase family protein [Acidobacteria bacterium]|nr:peptidoglycan DD-metalloendopeptidase family protein [Acidobacteriota bacterium]